MATMHEITIDENTLKTLKELQHRLKTDDPRYTADPVFQVKQVERIYGICEGYGEDGFVYYKADTGETVAETKEELDIWLDDQEYDMEAYKEDPDEFLNEKGIFIGFYKNKDVVATTCFTEQGAKDYIAANKNNLTNPFIYVESNWRNGEMIWLRNFLMQLPLDNIVGL